MNSENDEHELYENYFALPFVIETVTKKNRQYQQTKR